MKEANGPRGSVKKKRLTDALTQWAPRGLGGKPVPFLLQ